MVKRVSVLLVLLVVLITGGLLIARSLKAAAAKDRTQYRITVVKKDAVKKTVTATGVLKPWTVVDIKSKAGGRVDRLPVEEGSKVKKGQLIAEIDPSDTLLTVNTAQADIDSNKARVQETIKTLQLQRQQNEIAVQQAQASLVAAEATANAAHARADSASKQAREQPKLSDAALSSARATLAAEQARLDQMSQASHPQQDAAARAALRQGEANLKNAELQLQRQKTLYQKGFVAQSQVDLAQASYDVLRATVESAREKVNTLQPELTTDTRAQQARVQQAEAALRAADANQMDIQLRRSAATAALADARQADANVKLSRARLAQAKADRLNNDIRLAQIRQAEAQGMRAQASKKNADIQLQQTHVTAPSEGVILKKYVEEGTLITSGVSFNSSGTSIVQMGDVTRMYVDVQVDETDVAGVQLNQKVDITFDAFNTLPAEGKVYRIEPQAGVDQNVTTVHVRVEVDNSFLGFHLLKPGMNATCEFISDRKEDVVAVPNEALRTDSDNTRYVEIADGGKQAPPEKDSEPDPTLLVDVKPRRVNITVGLEGNDLTEVSKGLESGARVITQKIEPQASTPGGGNPFGGGGRGMGGRR